MLQKIKEVIGAETNAASPEIEANPQDDMPASLLKPTQSAEVHSADAKMFKANEELQPLPQSSFHNAVMGTFNGSAVTMDSSHASSPAEGKQLAGSFNK